MATEQTTKLQNFIGGEFRDRLGRGRVEHRLGGALGGIDELPRR